MASPSIPQLVARLARPALTRARARGLVPRRAFAALFVGSVLAAGWLAGYQRPGPPDIPRLCTHPFDHRDTPGGEVGDPIAQLASARSFDSPRIGEDGAPAPSSAALHQLLGREDAARALRSLLVRAETLEGQVYAGCGLAMIGEPEGARVLDRLAGARRWLMLRSGCVGQPFPLDALLEHYDDYERLDRAAADPARCDEVRGMSSDHNPPVPL